MKVLLGVLILLSLLSPTALFAKTNNFAILKNDRQTVTIQINPKAYTLSVYHKTPKNHPVLTINTNYFNPDNREPVGLLMSSNKWIPSIFTYIDLRPCLVITKNKTPYIATNPWKYRKQADIIYQAGPLLIKNGRPIDDIKREQFKSGPIRTTSQVTVGLTKNKKIIILYSYNWSIKEITTYLVSIHCDSAMKMDGGSSSHLSLKTGSVSLSRGNPRVVYGLAFYQK